MTTERQRMANRANAKRSTGPRSAKGKAVTAGNALKHGVYAERIAAISRGAFAEDHEQHERMVCDIVDALSPRDALEREQALRIAMGYVRLARLSALEAHSLSADGQLGEDRFGHIVGADLSADGQVERAAQVALAGTMENVTRLEARVSHGLDRALVIYAQAQTRDLSEQTHFAR